MKFSVVVALYNKQDFVTETLMTVLNQTFADFELICVDDGSTDESASHVQALADSRVILIRQANAGVSAARNTGIARARGEWVALLDADDLWAPSYLAELYSATVLYPETDMVATRYHASDDLSAWKRDVSIPRVGEQKIEWIVNLPIRWLEGGTFCSSTVAIRRSRLMEMQPCFTVGDSNGEDLELWFRLSEVTPIVLILSPLAAYRLATHNSLSGLQFAREMPPYLERLRKRAHAGRMSNAHRRSSLRFITQHEITLARHCIVVDDRAGGLQWLQRAGWRGLFIRMWWVTLMLACLSGRVTARLDEWRVRVGNQKM